MVPPLFIEIGLHYYSRAGNFDPNRIKSPAVQEALACFVKHGLLERLDQPDMYGATYKATAGLTVWCSALCSVSWPERIWVMPAYSEDVG